jgi:hypothetical protein
MARRKMLFHPDEVRQKIQTSQLLNRLHNHAIGELELTQTQIKAIEILLKKSIPDLSSVDIQGSLEVHDPNRLSDAELASIASSGSRRLIEAPRDKSELN